MIGRSVGSLNVPRKSSAVISLNLLRKFEETGKYVSKKLLILVTTLHKTMLKFPEKVVEHNYIVY